MRIRILDRPAAVAAAAADIVAGVIAARADAVLGLPTGRTAIPLYDELARRHARGRLDLSRARGVNIDELVLPGDHRRSFRTFMRTHAWGRTGLDPGRCEIPDGEADPRAECRRYDRLLAAAGGLDLAILGVGVDGHVAYNLPGEPRGETHVVELPAALAVTLEVSPRWRPLRAITVGLGTLESARRVLLMATGRAKAEAVRALIRGPEDPRWPCSLLRDHPDFDLIVDRAAAANAR